MNLDAENRVVLNVGGIRHETYKVRDTPCPSFFLLLLLFASHVFTMALFLTPVTSISMQGPCHSSYVCSDGGHVCVCVCVGVMPASMLPLHETSAMKEDASSCAYHQTPGMSSLCLLMQTCPLQLHPHVCDCMPCTFFSFSFLSSSSSFLLLIFLLSNQSDCFLLVCCCFVTLHPLLYFSVNRRCLI